jgi:hypothetical protein
MPLVKTVKNVRQSTSRESEKPIPWSRGLRRRLWSLVCWDYRFESRQRHGHLHVVSAVCCQVESAQRRAGPLSTGDLRRARVPHSDRVQ